ncbi:hypothetical protein RhiirA4_407138, partial [Rhizophagus irregularis]
MMMIIIHIFHYFLNGYHLIDLKVYSATWIDGKADYKRQNDKSWKKVEHKPIKVALKKL